MAKPRSLALLCLIGTISAVLVGGIIWFSSFSTQPALQRPPEISSQEYARGKEAFEAQYARTADGADVLSWLGESYLSRDQFQKAAACFKVIPTTHPKYGRMSRYLLGQSFFKLNQASEAEQQFTEFINIEAASPQFGPKILIDARQRLRHILEVELRFEELHRHLKEVVARGESDSHEVIVFCFPSLLRWNGPDAVKWLEQFHAADPTDHRLNVALGRYRTGQGLLDDASRILREAVRSRPDDKAAIAALIEALRQADDPSVTDVINQLPQQADDDPWLLLQERGTFAMQLRRPEVAIRAFRQLLEQNPTSAEAWNGLGLAYRQLGDDSQQKKAQSMATALGRIQNYLGKAFQEPDNFETFLRISEICLDVDLLSEGMLMTRCAQRIAPTDERVLTSNQKFQARIRSKSVSSESPTEKTAQ